MSAPTRLRDRVLQTIRTQRLWEPGQRVAVAVSGGLDSVVLLDVLSTLQRAHGGRLSVVSVDHGTRPDSGEDVAFVSDLAASLQLPFEAAEADLGPGASEATCRRARFEVFAALATDRVALAHHRDDQSETVVIRWVRGSGTNGLGAMRFRRDRYVRPLLQEPKRALLDYARARGLSWREDVSNLDPKFLRNRIRHEVLPLLEDLRPGTAAVLARTARQAAEDDALLVELAAARCPLHVGGWFRADLVNAPEPLARRSLLLALPQVSSSHIDAILAACHHGGGVVPLSGGIEVRIDRELVSINTSP